jgi:hypothetical protein
MRPAGRRPSMSTRPEAGHPRAKSALPPPDKMVLPPPDKMALPPLTKWYPLILLFLPYYFLPAVPTLRVATARFLFQDQDRTKRRETETTSAKTAKRIDRTEFCDGAGRVKKSTARPTRQRRALVSIFRRPLSLQPRRHPHLDLMLA